MNKIKYVLTTAVLGSLFYSSLTVAAPRQDAGHVDPAIQAEEIMMKQSLKDARAHQIQMKHLRDQVNVLSEKKKIADLVYGCKQKGVECLSAQAAYQAGVTVRDGVDGEGILGDAQETDLSVPYIEGLGGNLSAVTMGPGDEGYDPRFVDPVGQPPYAGEMNGPESVNGDVIELNDPFGYGDPARDVAVALVMPELLGIENNEAIFLVDNREFRAKGGTYLPGKNWKVRDVSFDNVWMKGPDGSSTRIYINWR